jgi:hypothetical protein
VNQFALGDRVRQISTGGTGRIDGIHPKLPPTNNVGYTVAFSSGPSSIVPEKDLEPFVERRTGTERRRPVILKYQGQCVIDSLAGILQLPQNQVQLMFEESFVGTPHRRDPSNPDHVFEVLVDYGYMISFVGKRVDLKGKCRLVGLRREDNPRKVTQLLFLAMKRSSTHVMNSPMGNSTGSGWHPVGKWLGLS